MPYLVNYGNSVFAVPGAVSDTFLRLADEVQLKVLLCYLRHMQENITAAQIAAFLHIEEARAEEALQFWTQADVLQLQGAAPGHFAFAVPQAVPAAAPPAPQPKAVTQRSSREVKLDPSEIASALESSQTLAELFALAEKRLGRPLNHMEQRSLLWICQYLGMPCELILMLLEYCISIGKYSISYAESIAIRWESEGILTLTQAEEELDRMKQKHGYMEELRSILELKRKPTTKQQAYIDDWQAAGYSMELLKYAYEITVENIDKLNFKYMDTILKGWAAQGATTPEQAKKLRKNTPRSRKKRKGYAPMTEQEIAEMNDYLSLVNRFEEDDT